MKSTSLGNRPWDTGNSTNWQTATLNTYLNEDYYNGLSTTAQSQIVDHSWNIGGVPKGTTTSIANAEIAEKGATVSAKVGLPTVTEYAKGSTDNSCMVYPNRITDCYKNNWIYPISKNSSQGWMWLLTPIASEAKVLAMYHGDYGVTVECDPSGGYGGVFPVVYLKSDTTLSGSGTEENPYTIVSQ